MNTFLKTDILLIGVVLFIGCSPEPSNKNVAELQSRIVELENENRDLKDTLKNYENLAKDTEKTSVQENESVTPPAQTTYIELGTPFIIGDFRVTIEKIRVEIRNFLDEFGDGIKTDDIFFQVYLTIENISANNKLGYSPTIFVADETIITDNWDNQYRLVMTEIDHKEIYPGRNITDVLYFEKPVKTAEHFILRLNAGVFSEQGVLLLSFDAKDIYR